VIQYFTYWTPAADTWNFHDAPIRPDGTRSPAYEHLKQVNREVQGLRDVFLGATVESVGHTGEKLPRGTRAFEPGEYIHEVKTSGQGAVVSLLSKDDRQFLVVVNRDLHEPMSLSVRLVGWTLFTRVDKEGMLHSVHGPGGLRHEAKVEPGDVYVLAWRPRKPPLSGSGGGAVK
jgi:hypothetical protein